MFVDMFGRLDPSTEPLHAAIADGRCRESCELDQRAVFGEDADNVRMSASASSFEFDWLAADEAQFSRAVSGRFESATER